MEPIQVYGVPAECSVSQAKILVGIVNLDKQILLKALSGLVIKSHPFGVMLDY